jgi:hypothetical protein
VLLCFVALDIYLGRWIGVRLLEYRRFRSILFPKGPSSPSGPSLPTNAGVA